MATFFEGRTCSVCGALISDDNPDGIGCTCRKVWEHAYRSAFYHFHGLEFWVAKSEYWARLFVKTCEKTKFRSEFRRRFYATISDMVTKNEIRLSKKMLAIITDYLIGPDDCSVVAYPKLTGHDQERARDGEQAIEDTMKSAWLSHALSEEEIEYIQNLSKKYYNENRAAQLAE